MPRRAARGRMTCSTKGSVPVAAAMRSSNTKYATWPGCAPDLLGQPQGVRRVVGEAPARLVHQPRPPCRSMSSGTASCAGRAKRAVHRAPFEVRRSGAGGERKAEAVAGRERRAAHRQRAGGRAMLGDQLVAGGEPAAGEQHPSGQRRAAAAIRLDADTGHAAVVPQQPRYVGADAHLGSMVPADDARERGDKAGPAVLTARVQTCPAAAPDPPLRRGGRRRRSDPRAIRPGARSAVPGRAPAPRARRRRRRAGGRRRGARAHRRSPRRAATASPAATIASSAALAPPPSSFVRSTMTT